MNCDIIVPTYNSAANLPATLTTLFAQKIPDPWHVQLILSDDGSTDNTLAIAKRLCRSAPWPYQLLHYKHQGAGPARNQAINTSIADLLLFLGSDIILRPDTLSTHLNFHQSHPQDNFAALGLVRWDPRLQPSPFMEWLTHGGPQNDFDSLLGNSTADPRHYFYGSHLSLKRNQLEQHQFSPHLSQYGWEDLELGRRLGDAGLKLHVLPSAIGLHRHYYHPPDIYHRQHQSGTSLKAYQSLHPKAPLLVISKPKMRKHTIIRKLGLLAILTYLTTLISRHYSTPRLFALVTAGWFWQGILGAPEPKSRTFPHKKAEYSHSFPQ